MVARRRIAGGQEPTTMPRVEQPVGPDDVGSVCLAVAQLVAAVQASQRIRVQFVGGIPELAARVDGVVVDIKLVVAKRPSRELVKIFRARLPAPAVWSRPIARNTARTCSGVLQRKEENG